MNRLAASLLALFLLAGCPVDDDDDAAPDSCDLLAGDAIPEVVIQDPSNSLMIDPGEAINWIVRIEDEDSEVTDIELEAMDMSNGTEVPIDFDLPFPSDDGRAVFPMPAGTLDSGIVTVRIRATDPIGCTGDDQVVLCIDISEQSCPNR